MRLKQLFSDWTEYQTYTVKIQLTEKCLAIFSKLTEILCLQCESNKATTNKQQNNTHKYIEKKCLNVSTRSDYRASLTSDKLYSQKSKQTSKQVSCVDFFSIN